MPKPRWTASRASPRRGHRAAEPDRQQPLHRGYRHRGVRLPPAALGPRRPELLPRVRRAGPAGHAAERDGRLLAAAPGARLQVAFPLPAGRAAHPRRRGRESPRARLRPRAGRRCPAPPRRAAVRPRPHARPRELLVVVDRAGRRAGSGRPADRGGRDGVPGGRRRGGRRSSALSTGRPAPVHALPRLQRLRHAGARRSTPALFSFNNPRGACAQCNGFGATLEYDESLVVPDPTRSLADGAIDPWTKPRYEIAPPHPARVRAEPRRRPGQALAQAQGGPPAASCCTAGRGATSGSSPSSRTSRRSGTSSTSASSSGSTSSPGPARPAAGTRLNADALAVRIGGDTIAERGGAVGGRDPRVGARR